MANYDVTLTPVKRASLDVGRKLKFWDDSAGTVPAVVKDLDGNVLTQPIKVGSTGNLDLRFDQWPVYYSDNRQWSKIKRVQGTEPGLAEISPTELGYLDTVVAGTAKASKAAVLGTNLNLDTIAIADGGLKLGAGAGTAVTATAAQLNTTAVTTAGIAEANKVALLGANKNLDTLVVADSGLKLGAGAGTAVTATAAELNKLDGNKLLAASSFVGAFTDHVTTADVNSGTYVSAVIPTGTAIKIINAKMCSRGGAASGADTVDIMVGAKVIMQVPVAALTQDKWVDLSTANVVTTDFMTAYGGDGDDVLVKKTGAGALATTTYIDIVVEYIALEV